MNRRGTGGWLGRRPISTQLVTIIVTITTLSVVIGSSLIFLIRANALLTGEENRLRHIALIAADFSRAPLAFLDRDGARDRLRYLQTIPQAQHAFVLDEGGEVFAEWRRPEATHRPWAPGQIYRISLTRDHFTVSEPVIGNGQNYGRIVILASTAELRAQLFDYLGAVLIVAGLVLPIAVLLAYRMQAGISGSIRHLAGVAQRISHEDDLHVRVTPRTSDEIADLYNAFNDMIARLQQRQEERDRAYAELDQIRAQLEERVALRTDQYREANEALEREFARLQRAEAKISQALAEKETLLREIHHRVKNNLQVVHSLLSLQLEPGNDEHTASLLEDARQRVKTIALVHETLYQSDNLADVEALAFIRRITDNVARIFHNSATGIRVLTEADDLRLDIDQAIPLGLVINELVTNAFKYAFRGRTTGTIRISLRCADRGEWVLQVADDGCGLPPGLDLGKPNTLGLMLVQALVGQLRGKVEITGRPGTRFAVRFPAA